MSKDYDLIIIGSGAGGGTLAYALKDSGLRILIVERGDFLPQEPENWDIQAVSVHARYRTKEQWIDARTGKRFAPSAYYYVGGNTKVYGACLPRLRKQDFEALEHEGGTSPAWPITYEEFELYYARAEQLYLVHGLAYQDPTEPPRSGDYPYPPIRNEAYVEDLYNRLCGEGLHPFYLPMGLDVRENGRCILCATCGGFACKVHAKGDAEVRCVRPALESPSIDLLVRTVARRLLTDETGKRIVGVEVERGGEISVLRAERYVVSCGAANTAVLFLRSANAVHPRGLANSSDQVGRNYMMHNGTTLIAVDPRRRNKTVFQKTLGVNDYYLRGEDDFAYPMGTMQMIGKLQPANFASKRSIPPALIQQMTNHSVDWWLMSEDLPDPDNRVTIGTDGNISLHWKPNNVVAHKKLVATAKRKMQMAGYPVVLSSPMTISANPHQCGTMRFGNDPATSVLDVHCKTHDIDNLYVVDSSFFPSASAVNPALTIAAQALRIADHMLSK